MKRNTGWAGLVVLAITTASGAGAQPTADKPKLAIGDKWEFTVTTSDGKSSARSWEIVEMPSADLIRLRSEAGNVLDFDGSLNFMQDGKVEFTRVLVKYPLKIGDEWTFTRKFPNPNLIETGKAKVAAQEAVTVAGRTLQCFRIEADASVNGKTYKAIRSWVRWYCPDVKWVAKQAVDEQVYNAGGASGHTVENWELTKFTPGT